MNTELTKNKNQNRLHTSLLVIGMTALMSLIGWMLFGWFGVIVAIGLTIYGLTLGGRASSKLVLRMYKAQPITVDDAPDLVNLFYELCRRGEQVPYPGLYYIPSRLPNALATGSGKSSAVAITDGLIRGLNVRELAGVLAHEIAHLRHRDTKVMGLADLIGRTTSFFSRLGLFTLLFSGANILMGGGGWQVVLAGLLMFAAPAMIGLMQLSLSRSREFNADMGAVEITGDPQGLASALQRIEAMISHGRIGQAIGAKRLQQPAFLRTHPPTEERIKELLEVTNPDEAKQETLRAATEPKRKTLNRQGEPVAYIGFSEVNEPDRYRVTTGIWR